MGEGGREERLRHLGPKSRPLPRLLSAACCLARAARARVGAMEPACFVKLEAMDDGDAAELRQLRAHYLERLHLKDFNLRSNGASKAVLQHSFPQVWVACCELQALQRLGTLLRLLRAVAYYELHGVVRGEPPPSADYFGRKLSALTGGKDVLALECVIDLTADDGDRSRDCVVIDDHLMEHQQAWQAPGEAPEAGTAAAAFRTVIAPKAAAPRIKLEDEGSGGAALAAPARPKRAPRAKGAAKGAASRGARNKRKAQSHAPWDGEAESDSPGSDGEDQDEAPGALADALALQPAPAQGKQADALALPARESECPWPIGQRLEVLFLTSTSEDGGYWYIGSLTSFCRDTGKHTISFDDGDVKELRTHGALRGREVTSLRDGAAERGAPLSADVSSRYAERSDACARAVRAFCFIIAAAHCPARASGGVLGSGSFARRLASRLVCRPVRLLMLAAAV